MPLYETFAVPPSPGSRLDLTEMKLVLDGVRLSDHFAHTFEYNEGVRHPTVLTHLPTGGRVLGGLKRAEAKRAVRWLHENLFIHQRESTDQYAVGEAIVQALKDAKLIRTGQNPRTKAREALNKIAKGG